MNVLSSVLLFFEIIPSIFRILDRFQVHCKTASHISSLLMATPYTPHNSAIFQDPLALHTPIGFSIPNESLSAWNLLFACQLAYKILKTVPCRPIHGSNAIEVKIHHNIN